MSIPLLNPPSFAATTALAANSKATRVLLVEDNESDALLVRAALTGPRDRGLYGSFFKISTAGHLSAARARLAEEHFDVILLDLSLPDSKSHEDSFFYDQTGQSLAALMLGLKSLAQTYETKQTRSHFEHLQKLAGELARDVHSLALELRPTALDDLGLEVALSNHLDAWSSRWKISADFHGRGFMGRRLAFHLETTIYRIAQEALGNIVRHARAGRVSIVLERADDRLILIVEDDGCGFDVKAVIKNAGTEQRLGLLGMKERVALVGGSLSIESAQGRGTTLYVRIPIPAQKNGEVAQ